MQMRLGRKAIKGFTFIEIMLVVVIIGILAGVTVPNMVKKVLQAKENSTRTQMQTIKTSLGMYEMSAGTFPSTNEGLDALVHRPESFPEAEWKDSFIEDFPLDGWHRPLQYAFPGTHGKKYDLSSAGKDGQFGTEDDITNWEATGQDTK